jgi:phosphatidylinositol alpha-1,6-mannosyltransferase
MSGSSHVRIMSLHAPTVYLYLSVGVFDKGGVSRYSRYQIQALREVLGERALITLSLRGPESGGFEDPIEIDYHAGGLDWWNRCRFALEAWKRLFHLESPRILWASHLHLAPLGLLLCGMFPGTRLVVNIYGEEIWSGKVWLHRWVLRRADLVIADCHFSADYARDRFGLSPERLHVVWDCVDLDRFHPHSVGADERAELKLPGEPACRYALTVGRLDRRARYKGYDRLIDAVAALRDELPHLAAVIAGDGNDRARLESEVRRRGLEKRVIFTGSVPERLLSSLYNACDLFVLVSDRGPGRGEGLPLVALEAAACGKPIVVGNEDGSQEAAIDGVTGYIVTPRNPESLVRAIRSLLADRSMAEQMGRAGRAHIERFMGYAVFRDELAILTRRLTASAG